MASGEIETTKLECEEDTRELFETSIGYSLRVPNGFEKEYEGSLAIAWYRKVPGSRLPIRFASIWPDVLNQAGHEAFQRWTEVTVEHPLSRDLVVKRYRLKIEKPGDITLHRLVVARGSNVLVIQSVLPIDAESLFACFVSVAGS